MAVPDTSIDPRLLASAKTEFLQNGFEKASLKTICENAGITTGALYKRYKGKEDLFCAVVQETLDAIDAFVAHKTLIHADALTDDQLIKAWDMGGDAMMKWYVFLHERRNGFILLISRAAGTRYANFQHDWVDVMTKESYAYYCEAYKRGLTKTEITSIELHIMLTAFWSTIYEPFIHGYTWEEIVQHSKIVCDLFNFYKVLGFE